MTTILATILSTACTWTWISGWIQR